MFDFWLETLIGIIVFLIVAIWTYQHQRQTKLEERVHEIKTNTYTKAEVIEHIDVRISPVSEQVKDVHRDVKDIKDYLMRKER